MRHSAQPIGLFDSGIGGLTVARHVMSLMPHENIVYFGDTARVPYGSKSNETVIGYAHQAVSFLQNLDVKLIVVACNTASAVALDHVSRVASVPVVGVIEPGARSAVGTTRSGTIGVIGTEGTVRSGAHQKAIATLNDAMTVHAQACPLFVGFAEEGLDQHPAALLMARDYLAPLLAQSIDTLILGCTHYPVLTRTIAKVAGPGVALIDPGIGTAMMAQSILTELDLLNQSKGQPRYEYYLSDLPHKFVQIGERFLGRSFDHVHRVPLEIVAGG